ncbi:MAG: hypothetical protein COA33_009665, partial [Fluviicola sp.]|nr:hypothetical protein [Fluviicola sp.]
MFTRLFNYFSLTLLLFVASISFSQSDNPCGAPAVTVNGACSFSNYSNAGFTATGGVPAPGCANYSGGDAWLTVTVPASGSINIDMNTNGGMTDAGMAIYSGTCGSLSLIECDDDDSANGLMSFISLTGQTPGATLWIRIWEYGNDNNGSFALCAQDPGAGAGGGGGTDCSSLEPICTDSGLQFTANSGGTDADVADPGNNYGCLVTQPNPSWYYLELDAAGNINMSLTAASDIDFIIYGPYNNLAAAQSDCGNYGAPAGEIEDCSFSSTNTEAPTITGGAIGDVYVMLITNYANVVQDITLTQTGGAGSTDCSIISPCSADAGPDQIYCAGSGPVTIGAAPVSNDEDDNYSWTSGAGSGTINNNPPGALDNGQVSVNPGATTTYTVTITNTDGCVSTDDVIVTVVPVPNINPLANVFACDSYTLPPITGTSLTGNEAYYTGPSGTGTTYAPGFVVNSSVAIAYIYDQTGTVPNCSDEISFSITIDNTAPLINCPGNLTATCSIIEQPAYASFADFTGAGGSASDETNLDNASFILLSEISNGGSCPEVVTRTYQIADACGHTSTCVQTITINDTQNPTATAPAASSYQCIGDVPVQTVAEITDEADNCSVPVVAML